MGTHGVEVPEQDDLPVLLRGKQVSEHVLDDELGAPIRVHHLTPHSRPRQAYRARTLTLSGQNPNPIGPEPASLASTRPLPLLILLVFTDSMQLHQILAGHRAAR